MNTKIPLVVVLPILKLLLPRLQNLAADYASDYLNERRKRGKAARMAMLELESRLEAEEEDIAALCARVQPQPVPAQPSMVWPLLSSIAVGSAVGLIVGFVLNRSQD